MNLPPLDKLALQGGEVAPTGSDAALAYLYLATRPAIEDLNFKRKEALEYLELVAAATKKNLRYSRNHRNMHNNVEHYLIGTYTEKYHASMFGGRNFFSEDSIGVFWENFIIDNNLAPWRDLWYPSDKIKLRFANNDGPNFRDHRELALTMFRASYEKLKKMRQKATQKPAAAKTQPPPPPRRRRYLLPNERDPADADKPPLPLGLRWPISPREHNWNPGVVFPLWKDISFSANQKLPYTTHYEAVRSSFVMSFAVFKEGFQNNKKLRRAVGLPVPEAPVGDETGEARRNLNFLKRWWVQLGSMNDVSYLMFERHMTSNGATQGLASIPLDDTSNLSMLSR